MDHTAVIDIWEISVGSPDKNFLGALADWGPANFHP